MTKWVDYKIKMKKIGPWLHFFTSELKQFGFSRVPVGHPVNRTFSIFISLLFKMNLIILCTRRCTIFMTMLMSDRHVYVNDSRKL